MTQIIVWSAGTAGAAEPGQDSRHWSLRPIRRPPLAASPAEFESQRPLDTFINAALAREGLKPAPPAERSTLLRRFSLDLTGLPPTLDELRELAADDSPDALDRQLDRLLASPRYGERWARPWLDLGHYADTDGYLTDQARPVAWRYRQWLIDALNRDLPWDQFTLEQLAGDLLPDPTLEQRIATGFLRNTLSNREGGADLEEFRVEQVVDRLQMVGAVWLGLTIGCARCHDHKFDPVSQREFFQLYAIFDSADEVNIDAPLAGELEPYAARRPEYERRRAELLAPVADRLAELQKRWEQRLLEAADHPGRDHIWDRQWEVLGLIWGGQLGEGQLEGTQIVRLPEARRRPDEQARLTDYFLQRGELIDPAAFKELKLGELSGALTKLAAEFPRLTRAPSMRESPVPRTTRIHERGDFRAPGEEVRGGVPSALPPLAAGRAADRLALAQWLVSEEHPLSRRVYVNRAWQELFGRGLVSTSDDFGLQGEAPSHPELLDWLVARFGELQLSQKALHRELLSSAAYRRSSAATDDAYERDPTNRWLARQAALRLSADQIRDSMLRVSGLLDERIGGPSVFPPQPASVAAEAFDNQWKESSGGDRYRRGLYTYLQRLSPYAQQVTFDAPSLSRACSRRERSNTPLQALTLLNDPQSLDVAAGAAARVLVERPRDGQEERLDWLFESTLGRSATASERRRLSEFFADQTATLRADPAALEQLVPPGDAAAKASAAGTRWLAGLTEFDRAERGAWLLTASVLMNLHEFVTRH